MSAVFLCVAVINAGKSIFSNSESSEPENTCKSGYFHKYDKGSGMWCVHFDTDELALGAYFKESDAIEAVRKFKAS